MRKKVRRNLFLVMLLSVFPSNLHFKNYTNNFGLEDIEESSVKLVYRKWNQTKVCSGNVFGNKFFSAQHCSLMDDLTPWEDKNSENEKISIVKEGKEIFTIDKKNCQFFDDFKKGQDSMVCKTNLNFKKPRKLLAEPNKLVLSSIYQNSRILSSTVGEFVFSYTSKKNYEYRIKVTNFPLKFGESGGTLFLCDTFENCVPYASLTSKFLYLGTNSVVDSSVFEREPYFSSNPFLMPDNEQILVNSILLKKYSERISYIE